MAGKVLHYRRPLRPEVVSHEKTSVADGIAAVIAAHEANGRAAGTIRNYRDHLRRLTDFLEERGKFCLEDVTAADLTAFFAHLRMKLRLSSTTIATSGICVGRLFNLAETQGTLHGPNPMRRIEKPRAQRPMEPAFTEDEIRRLWAAAQHVRPVLARNLALFLVLLDTGGRISEVLNLCVRDVDLGSGRVTIIHGKGNKSRTVFLSEEALTVLRIELSFRFGARPNEPLFISWTGNAWRKESVADWLHKIGNAAGVPNVHPHRFRKTFAVGMLRNGADLERLRRLLGHADYEMLQRHYLPLLDSDLQAAHERFSPVASMGLSVRKNEA